MNERVPGIFFFVYYLLGLFSSWSLILFVDTQFEQNPWFLISVISIVLLYTAYLLDPALNGLKAARYIVLAFLFGAVASVISSFFVLGATAFAIEVVVTAVAGYCLTKLLKW